jgi:hypothetical protein
MVHYTGWFLLFARLAERRLKWIERLEESSVQGGFPKIFYRVLRGVTEKVWIVLHLGQDLTCLYSSFNRFASEGRQLVFKRRRVLLTE